MKKIALVFFLMIGTVCFSQVGIATTSPQSTLDINGNVSFKVVDLNGGPFGSPQAISDGFYINLVPIGVNTDYILPDATNYPGRMYILRNITNDKIAYIKSAGGSFFGGDTRIHIDTLVMDPDIDGNGGDPSKTVTVISDGSNWTYGHFH